MSLNLGLIDYGMGNLHSVETCLQRLGERCRLIKSADQLGGIDALILPGVGAFDPAMANLRATGLVPHLKSWGDDNRPLLGICLGLQLLFEHSDEGRDPGLGLLSGRVERLPEGRGERIPHMGWAPLKHRGNCPLLDADTTSEWVYFVHSYAAVPSDRNDLRATAAFGDQEVTAMVWRGRLGACQFHPEKSSDAGEQMLRRWLGLAAARGRAHPMSGGGQLRLSGGRRLLSPGGRSARPTTSRVREAVMNILAPRLHDCRWLDLCSGSGVMGCEALQRGALCVVAVDQDPHCIRTSRANLSAVAMSRSPTPEIRTERRELIGWLRRGWREDPFDIVYFDPPYDQGLYEPGLDALAQGNWLHPDSLVVCEYRSNLNPVPGSGWPVLDQRRYGISSVMLLSPPEHCRHGGTGSMPPQTGPSE